MDKNSVLRLKLFRGKAGLSQITADWKQLTDRMDKKSFYHLVEWYECYMDALEKDPDTMFFCVLYDGDKAEAIFPFRKIKHYFLGLRVNILESLNHPHVPFNDFIFINNDRAGYFFDTLLKQLKDFSEFHWDNMCLYGIPEGSFAASAKSFMYKLLTVSEKNRHCNYFELVPYEQLSRKFSKNFQQYLKKNEKRLSELGSVSFSFVNASPELEKAFLEFLDVESSGWKGTQGTAIKLDDRLTLFYRLLVGRYSAMGKCEIGLLRHGDRVISAYLAIFTDDRSYHLKIAYDEKYKHFSPGNMLNMYVLKRWGTNGPIKTIDLISDASWHDKWMPSRYDIFDFYIFNKTMIGFSLYPLFVFKKLLRLAYRSIVKPLINSRHKNKGKRNPKKIINLFPAFFLS